MRPARPERGNGLKTGLVTPLLVSSLGLVACSSPSTAPVADLDVKIRLAHPCVAAGARQQLVARARPATRFAYAVAYSDGSAHGTGAPSGIADHHGTFDGVWTVPADAPAGKVSVTVLAAAGRHTGKVPATFEVGAPCA